MLPVAVSTPATNIARANRSEKKQGLSEHDFGQTLPLPWQPPDNEEVTVCLQFGGDVQGAYNITGLPIGVFLN